MYRHRVKINYLEPTPFIILLTVRGHVVLSWKQHTVGGDNHQPSNQNPRQENKRAYLTTVTLHVFI